MATITAHCLVKNEENFVWYAIKSVIDFVEKIIVFDTGSTDKTVEIIQGLIKEYPGKIIFEEKGECDKKRHTELRQEMIDRTTTEWFMILDGDEVWTKRGMEEAKKTIEENREVECLIVPFYLCVGDVYHYSWRGKFLVKGKVIHATPRFFRNKTVRWVGEYGRDFIVDSGGNKIFEKESALLISNKFWHLSHLSRSTKSEETYSSGSVRSKKKIETYFIIGKKIKEQIPEVLLINNNKLRLPLFKSMFSFLSYIISR